MTPQVLQGTAQVLFIEALFIVGVWHAVVVHYWVSDSPYLNRALISIGRFDCTRHSIVWSVQLHESLMLAVHVEESWQAWDDPHSFLEALNQETVILRKRVDACKSRVLIATCFDSRPTGSLS